MCHWELYWQPCITPHSITHPPQYNPPPTPHPPFIIIMSFPWHLLSKVCVLLMGLNKITLFSHQWDPLPDLTNWTALLVFLRNMCNYTITIFSMFYQNFPCSSYNDPCWKLSLIPLLTMISSIQGLHLAGNTFSIVNAYKCHAHIHSSKIIITYSIINGETVSLRNFW